MSVASAGTLPTGPVPENFDEMLRACGAAFNPADGDRIYLARGARVLRRADDPIDPAVAPHSIALEVRMASGQLRWINAGWRGSGSPLGVGCDDPSSPTMNQPGSERTFDDYVENLRDGNGIKLP